MTPLEKVRAWMLGDPRITQTTIAEAAGASVSSINQWFGGKSNLTDIAKHAGIVRRIQVDHPGADLDWYADEAASWPPPPAPAEAAAPPPTDAERRVLAIARELCEGDPTLRLARERLLGLAGAAVPMTIAAPSAAPADYEAEKARRADGDGGNAAPPRNRRPNSGA